MGAALVILVKPGIGLSRDLDAGPPRQLHHSAFWNAGSPVIDGAVRWMTQLMWRCERLSDRYCGLADLRPRVSVRRRLDLATFGVGQAEPPHGGIEGADSILEYGSAKRRSLVVA